MGDRVQGKVLWIGVEISGQERAAVETARLADSLPEEIELHWARPGTILSMLSKTEWDAVVVENRDEWIPVVVEAAPEVPVVALGQGDRQAAVALRAGANVWLPIAEPGLLRPALLRLIPERQSHRRQKLSRESRMRVRSVLNSAAEAIFALDQQGVCVFCNPAGWQLLGLDTADPILGQDLHTISHHSHSDGTPYPAEECPFRDAALRVQPVHLPEEVFWRADGSPVLVEAWSHPIVENGEAIGTVVTALEITARKSLERQLLQAQKMQAIGQLAGGVAHDFNNLLMIISGNAELLQARADLPSEAAEQLSAVASAADRAAGLARQLLTFSRQQPQRRTLVFLDRLVQETSGMLGRLLGEHIEIRVEAGKVPPVGADDNQLQQVLLNLAVNARDALPRGGRLSLSTSIRHLSPNEAEQRGVVPGEFVQVTVSDNGEGMDEATQRRIFDPFFTTKEPGRGTGLGLAMVYGIMQQHQGFIEVTSRPGEGSTFYLGFPRASATLMAAQAPMEQHPEPGAETVLVVEDEARVRDLTRRFLASAGYIVLEAADGQSALEVAATEGLKLDLIITDEIMPRLRGHELVEILRRQHPRLKVLFMSGYHEEELERVLPPESPVQIVGKPFSRAELLQKVRAALDEVPAPSARAQSRMAERWSRPIGSAKL